MENASKALLMAGGILIALMIIGALVLLGNNLSSYKNNEEALEKQSQIAEFNDQFEPYNKDDLTLMELKSLFNKIESNNQIHPEYEITTNVENVYPDIKTDFKQISQEEKQMRVFSCESIGYDEEGRINNMQFMKVK